MSEYVSQEEGLSLGLNKSDINGLNAAHAILEMIEKQRSLTPEQRFEQWHNDVISEIARLGYYSLSGKFLRGYNLAIRCYGAFSYELFLTNFRAYESDELSESSQGSGANLNFPVMSKKELNKSLKRFGSLEETYSFLKNYYQNKVEL